MNHDVLSPSRLKLKKKGESIKLRHKTAHLNPNAKTKQLYFKDLHCSNTQAGNSALDTSNGNHKKHNKVQKRNIKIYIYIYTYIYTNIYILSCDSSRKIKFLVHLHFAKDNDIWITNLNYTWNCSLHSPKGCSCANTSFVRTDVWIRIQFYHALSY